jgi:hypothetical protein
MLNARCELIVFPDDLLVVVGNLFEEFVHLIRVKASHCFPKRHFSDIKGR